jgi:predicted thioesterase
VSLSLLRRFLDESRRGVGLDVEMIHRKDGLEGGKNGRPIKKRSRWDVRVSCDMAETERKELHVETKQW